MNTSPAHITNDHYIGFGAVVNAFASVEAKIDELIMVLTGADVEHRKAETANLLILISKLQTKAKTDYLRSLDGENPEPGSWVGQGLTAILQGLKTKTDLRNNIAHCVWMPGKRAASIKPIFVSASGNLKMLGANENERDWIADELRAEAVEIAKIGMRLKAWMDDQGLSLRISK